MLGRSVQDRAWERYGFRITGADLGFARHAIAKGEPFALRLSPEKEGPTGRVTSLIAVRIRGRWIGFTATPKGRIFGVAPEDLLYPRHSRELDARKRELRAAGLEVKATVAAPAGRKP